MVTNTDISLDSEYENRLLTARDVAEMLSISPRQVDLMRARGELPQPIRLGPKCVRYSQRALVEWIEQKATESATGTGRRGRPRSRA